MPDLLLPDPEPRARRYPIISVDDHLIEPRDLFEGRMPSRFAEAAPYVVEFDDGRQAWVYEGNLYPNMGLNAVVGRRKDMWTMDPTRFDEMRKGCWDIHARIADMDIAGVWASLNFPSLIAGFAGAVFSQSKDQELGLACVKAWNDWHHEVWAGTYPERIIPLQITWLSDPDLAAEEVRRNAARGFKALSFPELLVPLGLPSLYTDHWDPLLRACEETETVICLHTGSSRWSAATSQGGPLELYTTLFPVNGFAAAVDWLWARVPVKFPRLNIALSEGGIGWVPMLLDRLDYIATHSGAGGGVGGPGAWDGDVTPAEAVQRNFWFCMIDDPSTLGARERIGVDHIMVEVDYPHADSSWPDTQELLADRFAAVSDEHARKMTYENAARLFRHQLPPEGWC
ncbi:MAG TPA: amidohydrolase family protein [Acidimicrobiales bacterium]|nr:amidohydrolase family protein [Acidimicrobiales bacterium]